MVQYASQGDPRRSMELLWGRVPASARGPRPGLSVAEIVAAAVRLADDDGLEAVSMRRLARRLGRSGMALYTYVPSKAELTDLMLDAVLGELAGPFAAGDGWRAGTERWARAAWDFYRRHPWVLAVPSGRVTLGPHELDAYEAQLAVLADVDLPGVELARIVNALAGYVRGSARAVADARAARQVTGMSDDEWWNARAPVLDEFLPGPARAERYPMIERLNRDGAYEQGATTEPGNGSYLESEAVDTFEFGLQRLLDGIGVVVSGAAGRGGVPGRDGDGTAGSPAPSRVPSRPTGDAPDAGGDR